MNNGQEIKKRITRTLIVIGIASILLILFYYLSTLTYPFLIALALTIMINPIVNFIEKKSTLPRGIAVFITMVLGFSLIVFFTTIIVAEIISGSNYLAQIMPKHINTLVFYLEDYITHTILPLYNGLTSQFNNLDPTYQNTIIQNVKNYGDNFGSSVGGLIEKTFKTIPILLGKIPNVATVMIFSLMATFFLSKDWLKFKSYFNVIMPEKLKIKTNFVIGNLKMALVGFIKAQIILITLTAVIVLIGLLILGVEHAITISLIIGLVDLLPYLGTGLVFVPWIIFSFFSGNISLGIGLSVLYLIVIIQRQVTEPKVLSSTIGLDPLATLVSLFVGFKLFGFLGLIIGPVVLVVSKAFYQSGLVKDIWNFIKHGTK